MSLESPQPSGEMPPPPPPPAADARRAPAAHERLIARVRTSQRREHWLTSALYGAATLALAGATSGFAAHASPPLGRVVWGAGVLGAAASLLFFGWLRARRQVGDASRTARWVGQRVPELSHDVLAAVELRRAMEKHPDFSLDLARAFLAQADARIEQVDGGRFADHREVRRAAWVLAGAAAVALLLIVLWPGAWLGGQALTWRVSSLAAKTEQREPITGDVELTYRYPSYTGLTPRTVSGTGGEIAALRGTEVQIKTRADREVGRADLVVNGQALPMTVSGGRDLMGHFVLDKTGAYHFAFLSSRGRPLAEGPDIPIAVSADASPQVRLLTPAEELEVDKGQKVTLKFEASDDYGLTGLALVYRPPLGQEKRVALSHDEGRRTSGTYSWDLGELPMQPGDRVSYFIEAKDNDAVDGPQRGVSRTQSLKLYSATEHRREAVHKVELLWERLVTHLANRLEGPDRADPLESDKVAAQKPVDQSGMDLASDMASAGSDISQERDAPRELWAALLTISDTFSRRVRSTAELRRQFVLYQRSGLSGMGRRLTQGVQDEIHEAERDVLYLETLIDRQKLLELKELAHQLESERRNLTSLIDEYKKTQNEALKEDIVRQVEALKKRINELMQRMAELAKGIRDEHLNSEALDEMMKQQDMSTALDEVERLMREGKTDEALAKLQQLEMEMKQMVSNLDKADDQLGQQDNPELTRKFQDFMNDLQQTEEEQKRVADETKSVRDRYKEKARERIKQKGDQLKAELLKQVEDVQQDYKQTGPSSTRGDRDLERAEGELESLKAALKAEDYDMAQEAADRAERDAAELYQDADQQHQNDELYQNPPDVRAQSKRFAERMGKDAQKISEVRQKLDQVLPQPNQMMGDDDRQKLKQLSGQQRQLEKRSQGLQQKMDELSQMAPLFDPEAQQEMNQVGQRMGDAAQRMELRDPNRGYGEQRAALEQLQQFRKQMQSSQGQGQGSGGLPLPMLASGNGRGGNGRGNARDKVEIPDADQYQAPKEFRKDLLDAMKQGAPDKYKDQVKRYYEELVK